MGLWASLKRMVRGRKADDFIPQDAGDRRTLLVGTRFDYASAVRWGLDSNVVMAPIQWIMRTFPEARLVVERTENGRWRGLNAHALESQLRRPNPYYDGITLMMGAVLSYFVDGNAYWIKVRGSFGNPVELWYVPHWLIDPRWPRDGSRYISHYDYRPEGARRLELAVEDVVHLRFGLDPRNPRLGLSPLRALLREVYTDDEASNFSASILKNMGIPGVVISPKDAGVPVAAQDIEKLKEDLTRKWSGDHRGEPLVMGAPTDVKQFGFDPNQLMLGNIRDIAEERVCLHPETQIVTKRGILPITEVLKGDEVPTHRGRWRRVLAVYKTPVYEPMIQIQADGLDPLRATASHQVLAATYKPRRHHRLEYQGADWTQAGVLVTHRRGSRLAGHWLIIPALQDDTPAETLDLLPHVEAERFALREQAGVLVHPSPRVQAIAARPALNAAFGRLLGFYLAEGSAAGNRLYWYFNETETEYVELVQRDLLDVFGVESAVRPIPKCHVAAVVVQSAGLARLFDLGRQPQRRFPVWAWDGNAEFRRAALWAWVQGDGDIRDDGTVRVTTRSRTLAWHMRLLAISCGYAASIRVSPPRAGIISGRAVLHGGPIYVVGWSSPSVSSQRRYRIEDEKFLTSAVRSVDPYPYQGPVYNLMVEEDESYLTTGGLVHNCAALGVPAAVVGFGAGLQQTKVGATMRELRKLAWLQCIIPTQLAMAEQLSAQLLPDYEDQPEQFRVRFDSSRISAFSEEETEKARRIRLLTDGGIMRLDEAQEQMGLERDPSRAIYLQPIAAQPIDVEGGEGSETVGEEDDLAEVEDRLMRRMGGNGR